MMTNIYSRTEAAKISRSLTSASQLERYGMRSGNLPTSRERHLAAARTDPPSWPEGVESPAPSPTWTLKNLAFYGS